MIAESQEPAPVSFAFWVRKLGPFLDVEGVMNLAALSVEELAICEEFGDVLALSTGDDRETIYPTFQFGISGTRLPGLREVVAVLRPVALDTWDIALWLQTVQRTYDGKSAVDLLWEARTADVLAEAKVEAARCGKALGSLVQAGHAES